MTSGNKIPINLDDLERLRRMSIASETPGPFAELAMDWARAANAEIARLRIANDKLEEQLSEVARPTSLESVREQWEFCTVVLDPTDHLSRLHNWFDDRWEPMLAMGDRAIVLRRPKEAS